MCRPLVFATALVMLTASAFAGDDLDKSIVRHDVDVVRALLAATQTCAAETNRGHKPLPVGARHGNTAIVRLLIEAGAGVNVQNTSGVTALYIADKHEHQSCQHHGYRPESLPIGPFVILGIR